MKFINVSDLCIFSYVSTVILLWLTYRFYQAVVVCELASSLCVNSLIL